MKKYVITTTDNTDNSCSCHQCDLYRYCTTKCNDFNKSDCQTNDQVTRLVKLCAVNESNVDFIIKLIEV